MVCSACQARWIVIDGLPENEKMGRVQHLRVKGFDGVKNPLLLKILEIFYVLRVKKVLPSADILVTHAFWAPLLLNKEKLGDYINLLHESLLVFKRAKADFIITYGARDIVNYL